MPAAKLLFPVLREFLYDDVDVLTKWIIVVEALCNLTHSLW